MTAAWIAARINEGDQTATSLVIDHGELTNANLNGYGSY